MNIIKFTSPNTGSVILIAAFLFLLTGNASRIIPVSIGRNGGSFGEIIIYLSTLFYFSLNIRYILKSNFIKIIIGFVLSSLLVGLLKWGVNFTAVAYSARLVLQIMGGFCIGLALFRKYSGNVSAIVLAIGRLYGLLCIVSLLLLAIFPNSQLFWNILMNEGIDFMGDPHIGRLVSTYFDPNFFGTIIVFPIFLAIVHYSYEKKIESFCVILLSTVCLVFTFSRSGLSLCALLLASSFFYKRDIYRGTSKAILKIISMAAGAFIIIVCAGALMDLDVYKSLHQKFFGVAQDSSALARFDSLEVGNMLMSMQPIFGFGYNYGLEPTRALRGAGLDSSLQVLLINFGLVPTAGFGFLMVIYLVNLNSCVKSNGSNIVRATWLVFCMYVFYSLIWAGNFNQIIFYPFWIIPIITTLAYFEFWSVAQKSAAAAEGDVGALTVTALGETVGQR